jgi:lactate dehydrogenase-like 2-hydroxyacid dehydrogenase
LEFKLYYFYTVPPLIFCVWGRPRVYILFKSFGKGSRALEILKRKCDVVIRREKNRPNKNELKVLARKYDGIIIGVREIMDREVLQDSRLEFIGVLGGKENIDLEECRKRDIKDGQKC